MTNNGRPCQDFVTELGQIVKKALFNESHSDLFVTLNKGISSDHQYEKGVERFPLALPNNCVNNSYPKQFVNPDISGKIKLIYSYDHSPLITESSLTSTQIFNRSNVEHLKHENNLIISDERPTIKKNRILT